MTRKTGNRLRVLRAERGWTQHYVAKRLGFGTVFRYWQIEHEQVEPTDEERAKLSKIFSQTIEEIFPPKVAA